MPSALLAPRLLRPEKPSPVAGLVVAVAAVAAATGLLYPLKLIAPAVSLGVLYVLAVLVVSTLWGLALGIVTSVLSAAAFSFFHLPPGGRFDIAHEGDWVALVVFVLVAVTTGLVAELARARSREAEQRRQEADLASELAQLLLGTADLEVAMEAAAARLAAAAGVPAATIALDDLEAEPGSLRFPLRSAGRPMGTLLLGGSPSSSERARIAKRVVPSLESVLAAALHRAELQAEVVETAALRRSDELKTAVLRSVSHDLRTPLAAILMAATALDPARPTSENVGDVREQVLDAATRLGRLIEKLLDLSVLQAGSAEPRLVWYSIDEVLQEALEQVGDESAVFKLSVESEMPLLHGDPGQLERAFANVLENAARYAREKPVSVRARAVRDRIRVIIVDQGPGIPRAEQERIFLPFYRARGAEVGHSGSGLGLAITKGFLELNGGRITVESQVGQGTSFVVEFPLPDAGGAAAEPGRESPDPQLSSR